MGKRGSTVGPDRARAMTEQKPKHLLDREAEIFPDLRPKPIAKSAYRWRYTGIGVYSVALVANLLPVALGMSMMLLHLIFCVCPAVMLVVTQRQWPRTPVRLPNRERIRELEVWHFKWDEIYQSTSDPVLADTRADDEIRRMRKVAQSRTKPNYSTVRKTTMVSSRTKSKRIEQAEHDDRRCSCCSGVGGYYVRDGDRYCSDCRDEVLMREADDNFAARAKAAHLGRPASGNLSARRSARKTGAA